MRMGAHRVKQSYRELIQDLTKCLREKKVFFTDLFSRHAAFSSHCLMSALKTTPMSETTSAISPSLTQQARLGVNTQPNLHSFSAFTVQRQLHVDSYVSSTRTRRTTGEV